MDRIHRMSRGRKTLLSLLLVGALGAVAGIGTFSAFSATTTNDGNFFNAGTVAISDNDAGAALYQIPAATPGVPVVKCIQVTYTGSLDSTVSLYSSAVGAIGPFVDLVIDKGTGMAGFPDCTGFSSQGNLFTGTLGGFAGGHTNFATGSVVAPGAQTVWHQNDVLVYRFTLTLQNVPGANGQVSGSHSFTWEAQNV
jgi:hypothetical protein